MAARHSNSITTLLLLFLVASGFLENANAADGGPDHWVELNVNDPKVVAAARLAVQRCNSLIRQRGGTQNIRGLIAAPVRPRSRRTTRPPVQECSGNKHAQNLVFEKVTSAKRTESSPTRATTLMVVLSAKDGAPKPQRYLAAIAMASWNGSGPKNMTYFGRYVEF
ncbi:cysteine protein inhibitor 5-like [Dorcoceras hygrometricum]|uniref:Cysteine protein inhibitor 5-like n=1 Tax=Dorcoceras hygrometricum TaxID=472368 RepID=A0A2Z7BRX7_9LAMI|nr:cysteine protein inhibitor 5-like [Dorcoceras hygrometricum]